MKRRRGILVGLLVVVSANAEEPLPTPPDVAPRFRKAIEEKIALADKVIAKGPYKAEFADQAKHNEAPEWYRDAKFGIYFHWGIYSVPEFGHEWYPSNMHNPQDKKWGIHDYHMKTYGGPVKKPYDSFVPGFTAEKFDAGEWVDLFVEAGARFAGPVSEHHDGYSLWDSAVTPWNSVDTGPKRDITKEMRDAVRKRGLKFITTFHHARNGMTPAPRKELRKHWHYANALLSYPEVLEDPARAHLYGFMPRDRFEQMWLAKLVEVIDAYQPDLIWFDSWLDRVSEQKRAEFSAYYLNRAKEWERDVVITFKQDDLPTEVGLEDFERGRLNALSEHCWLTDDTITADRSWCYTKDVPVKTTAYLVHVLADIISKNGCLLLNIAPKADGTIPADQADVLKGLGAWLKVNGEAIYGTRPWQVFGEGPTRLGKSGGFVEEVSYTAEDIRYSRSKNGKSVYAIVLGWPEGGKVVLKAAKVAKAEGGKVELLGCKEPVKHSVNDDGKLVIDVSGIDKDALAGDHAWSFKLTGFDFGKTGTGGDRIHLEGNLPKR